MSRSRWLIIAVCRWMVACSAAGALLTARASVADELAIAGSSITCVAITSNGKTVIDGSQFGVRIRAWTDLAVNHTLIVPCRHVHDVVLSQDETRIAVIGGNPGESAWVGMYSWPGRDLIWSQSFSDDVAYAASFSPSGATLAVACHDHAVALMTAETGNTKTVLKGHSRPVTAVAFVREDTTLLSCGLDQSLRVWDCERGNVVRSLTNHTQPITCLAVQSSAGNAIPMIATGSEDRTVRLWQPIIGRLVRFQRLPSSVTALAWNADGTALVAGCQDGTLRVVEAETLHTTDHASPIRYLDHCHCRSSKRIHSTDRRRKWKLDENDYFLTTDFANFTDKLASGMRQLAGTKARHRRAHAAPLVGLISGRAEYIHDLVPSEFTDGDSMQSPAGLLPGA
ncbi:MAG: hypothetical protein WKF77_21300 [Planctomycetaceae bacterium]